MIDIKSKLMRKGLAVVVLPLVVELVFIGTLTYFLLHARDEIDQRVESKKIVATATNIVGRMIDAEFIAMVYNAQKVPLADERFDDDTHTVEALMNELRQQCSTNAQRAQFANEIGASVETTFRSLRKVFTNEVADDVEIKHFVNNEQRTQKTYSVFTKSFSKVEQLLASEQNTQARVLKREKEYRNLVQQTLFWGLASNVILSVILSIYVLSITGRLKVVLRNTYRLKNREPLAKPIGGNDEIMQLDQVFHAAANDLVLVDKQRKHLVALVKGELGEPLRQVQLVLHNLSQGVLCDLSEKAETRLALAAKDTDRIVRLIDDLLSIENMEGARFDLNLDFTMTSDLISMAVASVTDMADRSGVTLEVKDSQSNFVADKDRIVQVLINLISNAIKFSPKGSKVSIIVSESDDDIRFEIIDRGRGVPRDKVDAIFQPFQQVDSADQTTKGGTGLGLPISKTIVQQHGGSIGVSPSHAKQGGSVFWFTLPKEPR